MLLWIGRFVPVKGLDILMQACQIAHQAGARFQLYLVGDGPLRATVLADRDARGLQDCVHIVGGRLHHELPDWYRAADFTVLTSLSEGIPNVLRESLACGTPFIATSVGGVPELAGDRTDWLVEPQDAGAFARAIMRQISRPAIEVRGNSQSWGESSGAFLDIIRRAADRSASAARSAVISPNRIARAQTPALRWSRIRRMIRQTMGGLLPRGLFLWHGPKRSRQVCLTFDDGPHPQHTPALLDVLRTHGVIGTFFLIGAKAQLYPDIVRRIADEGHAIGNHTLHHADPLSVNASQLRCEIRETQKILRTLIGEPSSLFRPPRGMLSASKLLSAWAAHQSIVLWNVDAKDFMCKSAREVRERFNARPLRGGDIVLMHDNRAYAANVLPQVISVARSNGLSFVPVTSWI
jgi:peptidoglycan/xylan/chitin deacetylase (PgdA/CDA1 family)